MSRWNRFREAIADFFRPWFDNDFSRDLWNSGGEIPGFTRGAMLRCANLSVSQKMPFGIFGAIGLKYAYRAACTIRPRELLLMEDISFAFASVWSLASEGRLVPSFHLERTTESLRHYFDYLGEDREPNDIRRLIEEYVREEQQAHRETKGLA